MILINCPNCGPRNSHEYRHGGEYNPRPGTPDQASSGEWTNYVYMRANHRGEQLEWWYHRAGCGLWFLARRDTRTNQVLETRRWQPPTSSSLTE